MKKHKNLIIFLLLTLLRSAFLGVVKFFLWSYLKDARSLEEIAGFISLGGVISYLVGGAIAYSFTKKKIILISGLIGMICLIIGYYIDYQPFILFAVLLSILGFVYSLWLTIKSIIISTEILESGLGETMINGLANITILVGLIGGSYMGFISYDIRGAYGFWTISAMLIISSLLVLFISYDKGFKPKKILPTIKKSFPNIVNITEKYFWLIVPIGLLRAVSTAIAQKMMEIGIDVFEKSLISSVMIIVFSFAGAIIGNLISAFINKNKKIIATIFLIALGVSVIIFPHLITKHGNYGFLKGYTFIIGLLFGVVVNILEGKYFHNIGNDNSKEYGSAAYGLITGIIMFFIMITVDLLTKGLGSKSAFFFCGITILLTALLMHNFEEKQK